MKNIYSINNNIHPTNPAEIKEGDWCYDERPNEEGVLKAIIYQIKDIIIEMRTSTERKIILTTDEKLIKDGIQPIAPEFIEWFAQNKECEQVEITKHCSTGRICDNKGSNCDKAIYKLVIPQKTTQYPIGEIDLTQLCYYDMRNPDFNITEENGYDKEEIEATGNFAKKDCYCDNCFYGRTKLTEQLIEMYTEEEVLNLIYDFYSYFNQKVVEKRGASTPIRVDLWFNQNKK